VALDAIDQQLKASEDYLSHIHDTIQNNIALRFAENLPGVGEAISAIDRSIVNAATMLATVEKDILSQINAKIQGIVPDAISIVTNLTNTLDSYLNQLINNIATTEDVITSAISILKNNSDDLAKWLYTNVTSGFGATILGVLKEMETQDAEGINGALDALLTVPGMPAWFAQLVTGFRNRGAEWQAFALPVLLASIVIGAMQGMIEPVRIATEQFALDLDPIKAGEVPTLLDGATRGYFKDAEFIDRMRQNGYNSELAGIMLQLRQQLIDPTTAARALIRGNLTREAYETELVIQGINPERANTIWQASVSLLTEEDIRTAFLRGILNANAHDTALAKLGYDAETAKLRRQLYFYIPPAQDLIHMAIRNVFNPDIVKRFELFGDFPEPFKTAAQQQGISEEWAQRYWGAHWIVPSNEEGFSMHQRTTDTKLDPNADTIQLHNGGEVHNIIGADTLKLLLREKDIAPFYRDKLIELSYRPLTRIDIRRLFAQGLLDKAGVERAYLDLGYKPLNARLLADFTEKLAQSATKDAASKLVTGLQRELLRLYVAGKLDENDVSFALHDLSFTDVEIEMYVAEANLIRTSEAATALEAGIGKLFVAGFITEHDATQRLARAKVPDNAIQLLIAKWKLVIEYRGGTEHIHKHRDLTRAEVLEAFSDDLMAEADARTMLATLGYDAHAITAELSLTKFRKARAVKKTQLDAYKAMFINGLATTLETSNHLDALHVTATQRDAYMAEWTLQRETRTERIPIATLRDMIKGQFIPAADVLPHLLRHRFTNNDAQLLIDFWTGKKPIGVSGSG